MQFDLDKDGLIGPFSLDNKELIEYFLSDLEQTGNYKNIHVTNPLCLRLVSDKMISESISQNIFGNLVLWRTNCFEKERGSKEIGWHHDRHFEDGDEMLDFANIRNHFSVLIALNDMDETSGLMEFVLGSHKPVSGFERSLAPFHAKTLDEHFIELPEHLLARRIQVPMKKGQFLIFHSGIIHRSLASTSDNRRYSLAARLCRNFNNIPPALALPTDIFPYPFPSHLSDQLQGKVILVTGGSSGIGKSIAKGLLKERAHVVITGRNSSKLQNAVEELQQFATSSKIIGVNADASNLEEMQTLFRDVRHKFGGIDVVFVNAATNSVSGGILEVDIERWQNEVSDNISASFITSSLAAKYMRMGGNLIFIGSAIGHSGGACNSAYSVSKGAIRALRLSLSKELKAKSINVNELIPGSVSTDMNPNGDKSPDEIIELATVLAKQNLKYGANGQCLSLKSAPF
ncbi:SDR family NAD(P)-dependent oxidoreductase [Alteromonas sp. IB21]|uniref:SDR family NAD(P)-dependent oxidoreductase n=1 Tax=Alteromonas sp. IB21 TaxID=2779369 RepID=UPI0018E86413|nr:SDR family NAD(P)-dependent oxidoreductase [Alteromonas sp. IB21]MBJ2130622.1 SDR family NAD(P)-dependent oxidoreductase [Alteromonas sp. IB21]